jgi:hypothetical protein
VNRRGFFGGLLGLALAPAAASEKRIETPVDLAPVADRFRMYLGPDPFQGYVRHVMVVSEQR